MKMAKHALLALLVVGVPVGSSAGSGANDVPAPERILQAPFINDWEDISKDIVDQALELGGEEFAIYGQVATTTFSIIDAFRGGKSFGESVIDVGKTLLPLISTVNPVLSFGLGVFMSIFGFGNNNNPLQEELQKAFQKLHDQIIQEVRSMLVAQSALEQSLAGSAGFAQAMKKFEYNPEYLSTSTNQLVPSRGAWWADRESDFNALAPTMFSPNCANNYFTDVRYPLDDTCKEFQTKGTISLQVPFVMTHLNILIEQGRLAVSPSQQNSKKSRIRDSANTYSKLLQSSLDSFKELAGNDIKCDRLYGYAGYCDGQSRQSCLGKCLKKHMLGPGGTIRSGHCAKCWRCIVYAKQMLDPSGVDIGQAMRCGSTTIDTKYLDESPGMKVDVCASSKGLYSRSGSPCDNPAFDRYRTMWRSKVQDQYGPIIQNLTRVAQPEPEVSACANEGQDCECTGQVYYGKRFLNGKPGSGQTMSFAQMLTSFYKTRHVQQQVVCSNSAFGDPAYSFFKQCFCKRDRRLLSTVLV